MHSIKIGGMSEKKSINSVCQMESQAGNRNANQDMLAPWRNSGCLAGEHPWKLMAAGMGGQGMVTSTRRGQEKLPTSGIHAGDLGVRRQTAPGEPGHCLG